MPTFEGWTPLHYACGSNMVEEVEFPLQNPYGDVSAVELRNGCTSLHCACGRRAIPIVKLLLGRDDIVCRRETQDTMGASTEEAA